MLIVQLQRFEYPNYEPRKVHAEVAFNKDLALTRTLFAETAPLRHAKYDLFAVINHLGALCSRHSLPEDSCKLCVMLLALCAGAYSLMMAL